MKKIKLTQGQCALVDDKNFEYLNQWKWYAYWDEHTNSFYAQRNEGKHPHSKMIRMHREIAKTPLGMVCDHKNHDTLNNQEYNLRNVNNSQNQMNSKVRKTSILKEKHISKTEHGFYRVRIFSNKKLIFSKNFKHLIDAISSRNEIVQKLHGEFAYIGASNES